MTVAVGDDRRQRPFPGGLRTLLDLAVRSHGRCVILLVAVTLLALLPGFFSVPPIDRDEARFAQATKQMIETGDFIDIRYQDTTRYKKPVGIYWLQAGAVKAGQWLGLPEAVTTIWLYRIPSLLAAIGAVLLTYWAALAFVSRRAAVLAALMMATCVLVAVEGRSARTDASLLLTAVAAMGAMARAYLPEQRARLVGVSAVTVPAVFWTAVAASILLKGPIVPGLIVLAAATLVIVDRSGRWLLALRPLPGIAWAVVLVLPWFLAITLRVGDGFFAESVGQDLFSRLFQGMESHGAPPGYYYLLFWVTFWPASVLAAVAAPGIWASRREPGAKFLLAWVVPAWIVFEIIVTKLPHYVLPLYPAIAILVAGAVDARILSSNRWLERLASFWFVFPVLLGIAGIAGLIVIGRQFGLLAWILIGAAAVMGFRAWQLYKSDGAEHSMLRAAAASVLITAAMVGAVIPSLTILFPSVALARILRDSGCSHPVAAAAGHHEPSLVFLAGTDTRLTDGATAAEFLRGGECRFAFIESRHERSFAQRADAIGLRYSSSARVEAFNFSNFRRVSIAVYRSGESP